MPEHIYKKVELVGSSKDGIEDAIEGAIARAAETLRNLDWFEVKEIRGNIKDGKPECMRGTFFANSPMSQGAQDETWWLELMDYIDQNYRTMGESTVDWTE